jgi:hypothetical protein
VLVPRPSAQGAKGEISPPAADYVEAVYRLLAPGYRLPLLVLVLDATGMRVGELIALTRG